MINDFFPSKVIIGHCPPAPPVATGPGLDRPLMPEYSSNDADGGAYTMNRTRLFYQEQYANDFPGGDTVDISRASTTAASSNPYSDRQYQHRERGLSSERRTSVGPSSHTYALDSPRR